MTMELRRYNGDYVPDGTGSFQTLTGGQELLQRVLWRLQIPRGSFPFLPELGSNLHLLLRSAPAERPALARQYVAQALEPEDVTIDSVDLTYSKAGSAIVTVRLTGAGTTLTLSVQAGG
ncbi:MAG: hypothetical protein IKD96_04020 [Oscillospiraceae bacterium]|nr:hypothetical protein [Oscillospiraceae bacterium]